MMYSKLIYAAFCASLLVGCAPQKNNVVENPPQNGTDVGRPNNTIKWDNSLPKEEANLLLFSKTWRLQHFKDKNSGQLGFYPSAALYKFEKNAVSFYRACNSCGMGLVFDTDAMQVSTQQPLSVPCTEMDCGDEEQRLREQYPNSPELLISPNSTYEVNTRKELIISTKSGVYSFVIHRSAADFPKNGLANTSWEIVAYKHIVAGMQDFEELQEPKRLSFDEKGFNFSPDCNGCRYDCTLDYSNNKISYQPSGQYFGSCTQKGCLNQERVLPYNLISNGMRYEFVGDYMLLKDDKYELKLRLQ